MNKSYVLTRVFAIFAATSAHTAFAEEPYIGVDYQQETVKSDGVSVTLNNIMLRAGTRFDKYWGFEVQAAQGLTSDRFVGTDGLSYKVKTKGLYAAFFKPQVSLADTLSVYLLLGAGYSDTTQTKPSGNTSGNPVTALAGGGGINLFISEHIGLGVEYVQYDKDVTAVNAGLRYKF